MAIARARLTKTILTVGGVAAVMWLNPTIASADAATDMYGPLIDTTCTSAQLDKALQAKAPQFATTMQSNQALKNQVEQLFNEPPAQRHAQLDQLAQQNPQAAQQAMHDPRMAQLKPTFQAIADSCHSF